MIAIPFPLKPAFIEMNFKEYQVTEGKFLSMQETSILCKA